MGKFKVTYEKEGILYSEIVDIQDVTWVEEAKRRLALDGRSYSDKIKSIEQLDPAVKL